MTPTITLFTYGTLRYGEGNFYGFLHDAYISHVTATTNGKLFTAQRHNIYLGYPVADFTQNGRILGDAITVDATHPNVAAAIAMEMNSGYVPCHVEYVGVADDANGFAVTGTALAFHCVSHRLFGIPVPDGDWVAMDARIQASEQRR